MGITCAPCHILLAEDNPADVGLVREVLREHKVHCDLRVICDGEQMLSFIDRLDRESDLPCPDLLLLDLHLPKRDGNDVLRYLRASERCARTPVVVFTSSDSPSDHESAERHAVIHYFRKPSSLVQFLQLGTIIIDVISRARSG